MKAEAKNKLWVLGAAFTAFVGGVLALQLERGPGRSLALTACFAVLVGIAVRQTVDRMKKKGD